MLVAVACDDPPQPVVGFEAEPPPSCAPSLPPIAIDTVAVGLEIPWDVAFLRDGRALVTERPGRVRMIDTDGRLREEPWAVLDVGATGLMGIEPVPAPNSGGPASVYVAEGVDVELGSNALSRALRGAGRRLTRLVDPERGQSRYMRVLRLTDVGGYGGDPTVVVDGLPVGLAHSGGALRLGPDGMLYLTKGEAQWSERAQDPGSVLGKVLRYRPDGTIPPDNPSRGSPVWASGLRDPEGLAWHPTTGDLFVIDHGPNGLEADSVWTDHDEFNAVRRGANLGWPLAVGYSKGGPYTSPLRTWVPGVAPGGLAFYSGDSSPWFGNAFVTGLRGTSLRRLELERSPEGWSVVCEDVLLDSVYGRLRLVRMAPDGTLWVGTSNRDQGGLPRENSDLILRLHPPGNPTSQTGL